MSMLRMGTNKVLFRNLIRFGQPIENGSDFQNFKFAISFTILNYHTTSHIFIKYWFTHFGGQFVNSGQAILKISS